jgi:prolyl oligopeptidase
VSEDGALLFISISESTAPVNKLYVAPVAEAVAAAAAGVALAPNKLVDNFDASYAYITNKGDDIFFLSNLAAPRYRVVRMNLRTPSDLVDVIPQHTSDVISDVSCARGDRLVVVWTRDVKQVVDVRNLDDGALLFDVALPTLGSVSALRTDFHSGRYFFLLESYTTPLSVYVADIDDPTPSLFAAPAIPGFDPAELSTIQTFYASKDGTKIPLFIVTRKGATPSAPRPTLLYGYGGFSISLTPYFSAVRSVLVTRYDAVFALANLRGGGEYGEEWHEGGIKEKKQNVFDDFIAAAETLIGGGWTSRDLLAIMGGSNGGLLVGAVVAQRPELFRCGIAQVFERGGEGFDARRFR